MRAKRAKIFFKLKILKPNYIPSTGNDVILLVFCCWLSFIELKCKKFNFSLIAAIMFSYGFHTKSSNLRKHSKCNGSNHRMDRETCNFTNLREFISVKAPQAFHLVYGDCHACHMGANAFDYNNDQHMEYSVVSY